MIYQHLDRLEKFDVRVSHLRKGDQIEVECDPISCGLADDIRWKEAPPWWLVVIPGLVLIVFLWRGNRWIARELRFGAGLASVVALVFGLANQDDSVRAELYAGLEPVDVRIAATRDDGDVGTQAAIEPSRTLGPKAAAAWVSARACSDRTANIERGERNARIWIGCPSGWDVEVGDTHVVELNEFAARWAGFDYESARARNLAWLFAPLAIGMALLAWLAHQQAGRREPAVSVPSRIRALRENLPEDPSNEAP